MLACYGDVPMLETLAAVSLPRTMAPDTKIRVVVVVNLMKLQSPIEHPNGLSDVDFDHLAATDKPIRFAFHDNSWLIHRLTYRRKNHHNVHVRSYKEEGITATPFDMVVLNGLDRLHPVADMSDRVPAMASGAACTKQ